MDQEEIEARLDKLKARMIRPVIECDEGWYQLLFDLDEKLNEIYPDYKIAQIKEKFGGLRFYIESGPEFSSLNEVPKFYQLIREAEEKSFSTCEMTGGPGVRMKKIGGGWIRTLDPEFPGMTDNWEIMDDTYLKNVGL